MSGCLWPHGLQHSRLPCPSLSPRVCSYSCPLNQWCHPPISFFVAPLFSCPQFCPASGSFPVSWPFTSYGQNIRASTSVFPVVMYGCESWIIKKAEHQRIDAFELWHWRRLLECLWQQGDQTNHSKRKSSLNIHWKNWCWSSNILAIWCEGPAYWKRPWCWAKLRAGE